MNNMCCKIKSALAAIVIIFFSQTCLYAQSEDLDTLFKSLQIVEPTDAPEIETKILLEWSKSGSPAMDLLLNRARIALLNEDYDTALKHLNALTDHAPNFVEGWSLSAVALQKLGKTGPALDRIKRTLAIEPRHFHALTGLAAILEDAGLFFEAYEVIGIIEIIHPHFEKLDTIRQRLVVKTQGQAL
jgi:tetratricopeptide (TPR) repeat protein